ncbi:MAG: AbrB/MazE/SpoVT family DNA-binding domain-containing protein [bacterium]
MKVFNKGQVVIPVWLRKKYNINVGDLVEVIPEDKGIRFIPIKKEKLTDKLFGAFAKYKRGKIEPDAKEIERATETGFIEEWQNEVNRY